jgi:translation initiation factor IF-2
MNATSSQLERPPIVVVMGHVDHGKSTLLDYIRKTNVVAGEAGGITQHVAAYEVTHEHEGREKRITFIDTPGHAAFQAIRARGANVADIAILVVAADDGVKAQTLEALAAIRESNIPFVVAINKIDKPNADLVRTQGSLLEQRVFLEKLGGDVPWAAISAKTGQGVPELLDLVLIVAELMEIKADPTAPAEGFVIEAHRDPKRGIAATLIITSGTIKSGMAVQAGSALAPVRIMEDHTGKTLREATFSTPISLVGFDTLPDVGLTFHTYKTKKLAEEACHAEILKQQAVRDAGVPEGFGERFVMPIIVRADASGSLEAITHEVAKLGDEFTAIRIIQSGIGNISENDTKTALAATPIPATIIGFHVGTDANAREAARQHELRVENFDIIYKLTERLEELLATSAPKRKVEELKGRARVLKTFSSRRDEQTIGGKVTEGYLEKKGLVRILRRKEEIGVGVVAGIQSNKQAVDRIEQDREFGAIISADFDILEGDMLECFITKTV